LNSGFNDCITKPFRPEQLYNILKKYHLQSWLASESSP
jgi:CheY-like chemotaxis protein